MFPVDLGCERLDHALCELTYRSSKARVPRRKFEVQIER